MPGAEARRERVGAVVAEVVRTAVADAGARGVVVLDDGSPEAALALEWCRRAVGEAAALAVGAPTDAEAAALARAAGVEGAAGPRAREEAHRYRARVVAAARDALVAHPANKTALLLGRIPPEPLLPLGDLYAGQVEALAGGWSAPEEVRALAHRAGGIAELDAILVRIFEERRDPAAVLGALAELGPVLRERLEAGRFARRRPGLVPRLGSRTLGIDLFA